MSAFYSHSTKNNQSYETFLKISEKLKDIIIDVSINPNNYSRLLDKITYHIKKADIFVCDLTPDTNEYLYPNPNVMLELGYALEQFKNNNIIYILNENYKITLPTMIEGVNLIKYTFEDNDDYYSEIIDCIENNIKNLYDKKGWSNFNYQLSNKFITSLQGIIDINLIDYTIRINNKINQAVILFPCNKGYTRIINIISKKLTLKNKEICLSNYDNLYNDLQHLELIINYKKDF
jgi:hypothetical protein